MWKLRRSRRGDRFSWEACTCPFWMPPESHKWQLLRAGATWSDHLLRHRRQQERSSVHEVTAVSISPNGPKPRHENQDEEAEIPLSRASMGQTREKEYLFPGCWANQLQGHGWALQLLTTNRGGQPAKIPTCQQKASHFLVRENSIMEMRVGLTVVQLPASPHSFPVYI